MPATIKPTSSRYTSIRKGAGVMRLQSRGSRTPGNITTWDGQSVVRRAPMSQREQPSASPFLQTLLSCSLITSSLAREILKLCPAETDRIFLGQEAVAYAQSIGIRTASTLHLP